jgi:hypothetical protein
MREAPHPQANGAENGGRQRRETIQNNTISVSNCINLEMGVTDNVIKIFSECLDFCLLAKFC